MSLISQYVMSLTQRKMIYNLRDPMSLQLKGSYEENDPI